MLAADARQEVRAEPVRLAVPASLRAARLRLQELQPAEAVHEPAQWRHEKAHRSSLPRRPARYLRARQGQEALRLTRAGVLPGGAEIRRLLGRLVRLAHARSRGCQLVSGTSVGVALVSVSLRKN